jgi:hypothetical protein
MNIAEIADRMLKDIDANGFNGVPTEEVYKESCWHEQYAIFVLSFDTLDFEDEGPTEYHRRGFDYGKFMKDFTKYLVNLFPGCTINYTAGCHEYEIIGPEYKGFWKEYGDRVEELESSREGVTHWFFDHTKEGRAQLVERKARL